MRLPPDQEISESYRPQIQVAGLNLPEVAWLGQRMLLSVHDDSDAENGSGDNDEDLDDGDEEDQDDAPNGGDGDGDASADDGAGAAGHSDRSELDLTGLSMDGDDATALARTWT